MPSRNFLGGVPVDHRLHLSMLVNNAHYEKQRAYFAAVDEVSNVLRLATAPTTGNHDTWSIPLDRIDSVWQAAEDGWHVTYRGW